MKIHKSSQVALMVAAVALVRGATAWCDAAPVVELPNARPLDLKAEATLAAKVSFEARQLPLGDVLAELQKQSGVSLTAVAGTPTLSKRVTARVKDMALSSVMGSLTRLYGVAWTKNGEKSYVMDAGQSSESRPANIAAAARPLKAAALRLKCATTAPTTSTLPMELTRAA